MRITVDLSTNQAAREAASKFPNGWSTDINKIRAKAVSDAIAAYNCNGSDGQVWKSDLEQFVITLESQAAKGE